MILHVNGDVNPYYVQTLCMVFFPGAKFHEDEIETPDSPKVTVNIRQYKSGLTKSSVEIRAYGKCTRGEEALLPPNGMSPERAAKLAIGRAMFMAGKEMFGHIPPWGVLTGVRPSKVAMELIESGNGILHSKRILRDEYFLNPQKAALAVSVANTERALTKKLPPNLCSIYISIPFCPSRCDYCSFVSFTSKRLLSLIDDYLEKLYLDLENMVGVIRKLGLKIATVYIGGGTPTVLNEVQLKTLLDKIASLVDVSSLMEYTLESGRPDTITEKKFRIAKEYGVTRVSVNPQTLSDEILEGVGRHHTVDDFYKAYELASQSGIPHINVDLIAGLPGDNFSNFAKSIDGIIDLNPSNITVHTFYVKRSSDIVKDNKQIYSADGGDVGKSVAYSQLKTKFAGYHPYYLYRQKNTIGNLENVGYAKEGADGMYNIFMMEELHSIFAVGAGAVTKLVYKKKNKEEKNAIERIFTPKYPYEYLRDADDIRMGNPEAGKASIEDRILAFYKEHGLYTGD